jgi:hypothetical protein
VVRCYRSPSGHAAVEFECGWLRKRTVTAVCRDIGDEGSAISWAVTDGSGGVSMWLLASEVFVARDRLGTLDAIEPTAALLRPFIDAGLLPAIESQAAHLAANPDLDWRGIPSSILREDLEQRYQDGEYARAGVRLMQLMVREKV